MDIVIIVISGIVLILGILGCFLPVIPGPPVSWLSMLVLHLFKSDHPFTTKELVIYAVVAVLVTAIDYFLPVVGTKKFGGTKAGVRGSTFGLIAGVIVLPFMGIVLGPFGLFGIILGPFAGAYIGETIGGLRSKEAMRAAIGSFIGFLSGVFLKIVVSVIISVISVKAWF